MTGGRGPGTVIWLTGLSGAGKTSIVEALWRRFESVVPELVKLDGDVLRAAYDDVLGYEIADRIRQIKRIQSLAKVLADQRKLVLVAALYASDELLAWNRRNFPDYFEAYVEAPLDLLMERDVKGLYGKAFRGEMPNVVGLDIPWTPPRNPDIILDRRIEASAEDFALTVARRVPRLAHALQEFQLDLDDWFYR